MTSSVTDDPNRLLRREQLAEALTARGYRITAATLKSMATRGGGPPFRKFGKWVSYEWGPSLKWAESRLSPPRHSTSEADRPAA